MCLSVLFYLVIQAVTEKALPEEWLMITTFNEPQTLK
jgi:hypothetical protein